MPLGFATVTFMPLGSATVTFMPLGSATVTSMPLGSATVTFMPLCSASHFHAFITAQYLANQLLTQKSWLLLLRASFAMIS